MASQCLSLRVDQIKFNRFAESCYWAKVIDICWAAADGAASAGWLAVVVYTWRRTKVGGRCEVLFGIFVVCGQQDRNLWKNYFLLLFEEELNDGIRTEF